MHRPGYICGSNGIHAASKRCIYRSIESNIYFHDLVSYEMRSIEFIYIIILDYDQGRLYLWTGWAKDPPPHFFKSLKLAHP